MSLSAPGASGAKRIQPAPARIVQPEVVAEPRQAGLHRRAVSGALVFGLPPAVFGEEPVFHVQGRAPAGAVFEFEVPVPVGQPGPELHRELLVPHARRGAAAADLVQAPPDLLEPPLGAAVLLVVPPGGVEVPPIDRLPDPVLEPFEAHFELRGAPLERALVGRGRVLERQGGQEGERAHRASSRRASRSNAGCPSARETPPPRKGIEARTGRPVSSSSARGLSRSARPRRKGAW